MKKIEVIVTENEQGKFEVVDQAGKIYSTCSRKYDAKRAASKNDDLIVVEEFTKEEPKPQDLSSIDQKDIYGEYQSYIQTHANGPIKATGDLVANFCKNFNLKLSKKKRSLTFERVLEDMEMRGMVERVPSNGKYKKLIYNLVEEL